MDCLLMISGLNVAHVNKAQPQYCSNVCMKVNAKLGGTSCKVVNANLPFPRPTMIIGADVSHPAPGSLQASMAAITVSFDKHCCRYAAAVQTNGHRVEMIHETNIKTMLMPLIRHWISSPKAGAGTGPQHIYYFRDGVSEGQYSKVLNEEVAHMKAAMIAEFGESAKTIKWTVAVCTKRHHVRFFPKDNDTQAGDRNGNPLPGTLVENDVTHPFEYDFYLNAHTAIQGTARPVHYQILLDEAKVPVNYFQKMIYNFSYQYMRSTTPVSICKFLNMISLCLANSLQSPPFTMLTWLPIVLAHMRLRMHLLVPKVARSLRSAAKMPQLLLTVAVPMMALLKPAHPPPLTFFLSFPWAIPTTVRLLPRFVLACGTSRFPHHFSSSIPCFARFRFSTCISITFSWPSALTHLLLRISFSNMGAF
jgi:hypothetical protein